MIKTTEKMRVKAKYPRIYVITADEDINHLISLAGNYVNKDRDEAYLKQLNDYETEIEFIIYSSHRFNETLNALKNYAKELNTNRATENKIPMSSEMMLNFYKVLKYEMSKYYTMDGIGSGIACVTTEALNNIEYFSSIVIDNDDVGFIMKDESGGEVTFVVAHFKSMRKFVLISDIYPTYIKTY